MSLRSPFSPVPVPNVALHRQFFEHFKQHGDKIALVDDISNKEYTYNDVIGLSKRVASGLVKLGVQKGDVFSLYSFNSPELVIMMWAVFATGATVTSINPTHTAYELNNQLLDSSSKFIYTSNEGIPTVIEAIKDIIPTKNMVVCADDGQHASFKTLTKDNGSQWKYLESLDFNTHEDVVILLYSSGTTGKPKGVPLTHHNVLYNSVQRRHSHVAGPLPDVISIVISPLYHAYAFATFVCGHMAHGAKLIIQKQFDVEQLLKAVQFYKVTHLYLVSSAVVRLAKSPLTDKYNISSLKEVYSAGAPLSNEAQKAIRYKMGIHQIKQAYGMTEASIITWDIYSSRTKDGSVGVLLPGLEGQIVDLKSGEPLGPDERGEFCVRGPQMLKQYLNRPDATEKAFDSNGWFHTGDVAFYDEDNYIYLVDRIKDMFKVFNFQVSPTQLEGVLFNHPAVLDVGVVGVPDEIAMNRPKAFVVRNPDVNVTEKELCQHVADLSAKYKWLTGGVQFVNEIPKLPSGKIIRRQLQEMALKSVEHG